MKLSRRLLKISCSVLLLSISTKANAIELKDPKNLFPKFVEHMSNENFDRDFVLGNRAIGEQRTCNETCFKDYYSREVIEKTDTYAKIETYEEDGRSVDVELVYKDEYENTAIQATHSVLDGKVKMAIKNWQNNKQKQSGNDIKTYVQLDALLIQGTFASLNLSGKLCDDATGVCDSFLMNLNFSNAETYLTKLLETNIQIAGFRLSNVIEEQK